MERSIRVAAIQSGPLTNDPKRNLDYNLELFEKAVLNHPDYVVFPELGVTPFFCIGLKDKSFFALAEKADGPTIEVFSKKAREYGTTIVLPFFERGDIEGEYFDSAIVIDQNGNPVIGVLPDGREVKTVRKNYISDYRWGPDQVNDEKYYFRTGVGHPTFKTSKAKIGVLICYERWYPEAWRVLSLKGAEIIIIANASAGFVSENAICLLKANSAMNAVFCVCVNKSGLESIKNTSASYYGLSAIIDPKGNVLSQAKPGDESIILTANLDLEKVHEARTDLFVYRDRRPEFYEVISSR